MPNNKPIYDKGKVIAGLIIFVVMVTFPFWYNHGKAAPAPEPKLSEKAKAAKECVRPKEFMKAEHMQVLDVWRDTVVRDGQRFYERDGQTVMMSLTRTCLDCHGSREEFCTKCHDYVGVTPHCWDCHLDTAPLERVEEGQ